MKHELIMSGLLVLGNPMMANAQQTKTTTTESISTAKNISTDSIQAIKEKLRQDSIQWEKQLAAVTIKGTRSQFRQKNGGIVARISGTSLEKEPTATEVLAKLPGMFKKQGWETAGIYRRLTRNLHQRQKGAGLQRGRKPARYTDKRGEGDSSSRS